MEIERQSQDDPDSYTFQDTVTTEHHLWSLECERLWHQIKDVQGRLEKAPTQAVGVGVGATSSSTNQVVVGEADKGAITTTAQSEDQVYRLLQEYEKRLRAELTCLHGRSVIDENSLPNKEVEYLLLQQTQRTQKQQLKESLSHVRAKHSSLLTSINQEEEMNAMLKEIQDTLKTKSAAVHLSDGDEERTCPDTAVADLKTKVNKLKQANKQFQKGLKDLLSEFPSPSSSVTKDQDKKRTKTALDNTIDFDDDNFMSLSSIIGKLMEQSLNTPEQPYIEISADMWPQHLEFLLRSKIVLKHPDTPCRMKLVSFHL